MFRLNLLWLGHILVGRLAAGDRQAGKFQVVEPPCVDTHV